MIDKLSEVIAALLPPGAGDEMRANLEAALRAHLRKMDLVTREEFAVQEKVLQRTRERVGVLEREVAELEKALALEAPGGARAPAE